MYKHVLVLEGYTKQSLPFIRGFKKLGCEVTVLCGSKWDCAYHSRYAAHKILGTCDLHKPAESEKYIVELIKTGKYDMEFAPFEFSARILSHNKEELSKCAIIYANEPDSYSMYSRGLCPSICRVQYQFYQEQVSIAKELGIDYPKWDYEMFFSRRSILTQKYMGLDENGKDNVVFPLDKPCDEGNTGPNDINHRYINEDIPVGCKIYHDLGVKFGVPRLLSMQ